MKVSVVIAAFSAGFAVADMLPSNFPDCGTLCWGNMLNKASSLGCNGGTTENAVDGTCLCKNVNFSYGVRDCARAVCPSESEVQSVIQYGVNWCGAKGIIINGLGVTADPATATAPSTTVVAGGTGTGGSASSSASTTTSGVVSTLTNSDGSVVTTTVGTATNSNSNGGAMPISTTAFVSTITNSDGSVVTSTFSTSVEWQATTPTTSGSGIVSTTVATETTTASTDIVSTSTTEPATDTETAVPTTTTGHGSGPRQTAAPVGLIAAAGLAALLL
ncbi:hypothetical protein F5Y17DRAFT_416525 [Xylariaceae sp. FL0594]|nr:hypothetical protein F5Y17DRAFT_416525 [Xylariaceae sp. FL0594]